MKNRISILIILFSLQILIFSQQIITSAGGTAKAGQTSLQWTLGQIMTGSTTDGKNFLIQGFQQSTLSVSNIFENNDLGFKIKVYPNPVKSNLIIEIDQHDRILISAKLYNSLGEKQYQNEIECQMQIIDLSEFKPGPYFLIFSEKNQILSTFTVIKQ
jgi:serine phosphatase RsbU (regulator of sigma subunit)